MYLLCYWLSNYKMPRLRPIIASLTQISSIFKTILKRRRLLFAFVSPSPVTGSNNIVIEDLNVNGNIFVVPNENKASLQF